LVSSGILITFDDTQQLVREHDERLSKGRTLVPGEHAVEVGERCEAVLVHPDSGEALAIDAEVAAIDDAGVELRFAATPLVKNQLRKFLGTGEHVAPPHERVRRLSAAQRLRLALNGEHSERVALDRAFGKEVWDALLQNPKISVGEVTRLARMGNMPMPLLEQIVNHNSWITVPQIRRALLSNPRLDQPMILRILRFTPPNELKLLPKQTAYPTAVRSLAKEIILRN
jgi:hypothetical protein